MSSLPPDQINGNILDAAVLNTMIAARAYDLTPIDPITRLPATDAYDCGSSTVRWKDGHFSGDISAQGQYFFKAKFNLQGVSGGGGTLLSLNTPQENTGFTWNAGTPTDITIIKRGTYLVIFHMIMDSVGTSRIEWHFQNTGLTEIFEVDIFRIGSTAADSCNSAIIKCGTGDAIKFRGFASPGPATLDPNSKIEIAKLN